MGNINDLPKRWAFSNHAPDEAPLNICIMIFTLSLTDENSYHNKFIK